jgi:hypothetical protein
MGDGSLTAIRVGHFNLKAKTWEMKQHFESDSVAFLAENTDIDKVAVHILRSGTDMYLTAEHWPAKLRGRWLKMSVTDELPEAALSGSDDGEGVFLSPLLNLDPISVVPAGDGWILTGTVKAPIAIAALGLSAGFSKAKVSISDLKGSGEVTIDVGPDASPTGIHLDGGSVRLTSPVPEGLRQALAKQNADVRLSDLRTPVRVTVPAGRDLIDPAEMQP